MNPFPDRRHPLDSRPNGRPSITYVAFRIVWILFCLSPALITLYWFLNRTRN